MSNDEIFAYIVKNKQVLTVTVSPHGSDTSLCYVTYAGLPQGRRELRLLSGVFGSYDAAAVALHEELNEIRLGMLADLADLEGKMLKVLETIGAEALAKYQTKNPGAVQ